MGIIIPPSILQVQPEDAEVREDRENDDHYDYQAEGTDSSPLVASE
jgi:hypothetical protein